MAVEYVEKSGVRVETKTAQSRGKNQIKDSPPSEET